MAAEENTVETTETTEATPIDDTQTTEAPKEEVSEEPKA
jgi:hypothetical protein